MFNKERLLTISEIKGGSKLSSMSDGQFANYDRTLNAFIDNFPAQADKMRAAVEKQDYTGLTKTLTDVATVLEIIFATGIAQDVKKQIHALGQGGTSPDVVEAAVEKLILNISSLSIDIQMSAHKKAAAPQPQVKQIFSAGTGQPSQPSSQTSGAKQIFSAGAQGGSGRSILAVDNAIMFLNTLKKLLGNSSYDLHCETSGNDALNYLSQNRVDLLLLDIEMPGMDGYELAQRAKNNGCNAPVIFITANSARKYVEKAIAVGAVGLLMKPLRQQPLLSKIKEFL
jgi:CheY-like chemotaxis protein